MNFNFPLILLTATVISGLIYLCDVLFWAKKRAPTLALPRKQGRGNNGKLPLLVDYARSFFPVLLLVLIIRSFIIQPFRVPTGSLEPTVMPGDFILVSQFSYGLRFPVWGWKFLPLGEPRHGDIVVFHWPVDPSKDFVKRVIGLPGDHISYINKVLYINDQEMSQKFIRYTKDTNGGNSGSWQVSVNEEDFFGKKHQIYVCAVNPIENRSGCPNSTMQNFYDVVVPAGHYFMMGDNRDDSDDSRFWGFVPEENLVGKAFMVFLSWDAANNSVRWKRVGTGL